MTAPATYCDQCRDLDICCARQACVLDAPRKAGPAPSILSTPWLWFGDAVITLMVLGALTVLLKASGA